MADNCTISQYNVCITFSCLFGVLLSVYAYYVEVRAEEDSSYQALCDISQRISCTKVFTSEYGRGFGILGKIFGHDSVLNQPNGFNGTIFYTLVALLGLTSNLIAARVQITLTLISNGLSLYLAYLLYFVLDDFCVVCVSTYGVNFMNMVLTLNRYEKLKELQRRENIPAVEVEKKDE